MNIHRETFNLDTDDLTNVVPSIVLVVREEDGEIRLVRVNGDHREAARREESLTDFGVTVLMRIEGETDLGTGDASVWVRN